MEAITKLSFRGITTRTVLLTIAIGFAVVLAIFGAYSAMAQLPHDPASYDCGLDAQGANDIPGQKDLTQMCEDTSDDLENPLDPFYIKWGWDVTGWTGNNRGDACSLYDTDDPQDGYANYALCVTVFQDPAVQDEGDPAYSPRLYECDNSHAEKCANPILLANHDTVGFDSSCIGAAGAYPAPGSDPFPAGDDSPYDTVAECEVYRDEIGATGALDLLDVCSYPSEQPGSDPSDCIIYAPGTGTITVNKSSDDPSGLFTLQINGDDTAIDVGDGGTTGVVTVSEGLRTVSEIAGTGTDLNDYDSSGSCTGSSTNNGTPSPDGRAINGIDVNPGDEIVCTFTNTLKTGSLEVSKIVEWNGVIPAAGSTFEICLSGPSYPVGDGTGACKDFIYDGALVQTWTDLLPGDYVVTESDPGALWSVSGSGQTVAVSADTTSTASVTNTRLTSTITACKLDSDGTYLPGWTIDLSGPQTGSGVTSDGTSGTLGCVDFVVTQPGDYTLAETLEEGWTLVSPADNQHDVAVTLGTNYGAYDFVNFEWADITACKYDPSGNPLSAWTMNLAGPDAQSGTTTIDGCVTFTVKQPGDYTISETLKDGWTLVSPEGNSYAQAVASNGSYGPFDFVNFKGVEIKACKVDTEGNLITGWLMTLDKEGATVASGKTSLNAGGTEACVTFIASEPGDYTLVEETRAGWTHMDDPSWEFTAGSGGNYSHTFTNFQHATLQACKTDSEGNPVPGWGMSVDGQSGVTGEDGCATFSLTQPGDYTLVEETRAGWTQMDNPSWDFTAGSGGSYSHTFANFQYASVEACKTDSEGVPVPGWGMSVGGQSGVTGEDGCVSFTLTQPGAYTLVEETRASWTHLGDPSWDFIAESAGSYSHTFANFEYASLEACKVDSEGVPVPGWGMSVDGQSEVTGSDGCASFTLTQPGAHTLVEETRAGWTHLEGPSWDFVAESAGSYSHTFTNFQYATVTACKQDSAGVPVPGWGISVDGQSEVTGSDGCVSFTLTQPGAHTLVEETRAGWTHLEEPSWDFVAESAGSYSHTFSNFQHATVTACKEDSAGDPVPGWGMSVGGQSDVTGEDGCVSFTLTQPGDYTLVEETQEGWTHLSDPRWGFTADSGGSYSHTFTNFQHATVTACKVDSEGDPVPGWGMSVDGQSDVTGEDGCVSFTLAQSGTYTLVEETRAGWTHLTGPSWNFSAESGGSYSHTFANFQYATLEACKEDSEGDPVPGWGMSVDGQSDVTGANGCVYFTLTQPGDYTLVEGTQEGWTHMDDPSWGFSAESGGSYSHTFTNFQHATITACKEDHLGAPLSGWTINLHDALGVEIADKTTGSSGCVEFTIQEPADYSLTEDAQADWVLLVPASGSFEFSATSGLDAVFTFVNATIDVSIDKQIRAYADGELVDSLEDVIVATPLYYQFIVTNTGGANLQNVAVTDPSLAGLLGYAADHAFCEIPRLAAGASVACPDPALGPVSAVFTGWASTFSNTGYASGCAQADPGICTDVATDTAHYRSLYWAFTPAFWVGHADPASEEYAWGWTAYLPGDPLGTIFDDTYLGDSPRGGGTPFGERTLLETLNLKGGAGVAGAKGNLLRSAVAALLNASFHELQHCDGSTPKSTCTLGPDGIVDGDGLVLYPYTSADLITAVNAVLDEANFMVDDDGDPATPEVHDELAYREAMLLLASELDKYNNGIEQLNWADPGEYPPLP